MKKRVFKQGLLIFLISLFYVSNVYAFLGLLKFEVSGNAFLQEPSGNFSYQGNSIDLVDTLGYEKKTNWFLNGKLYLPIIRIFGGYTPVSFDGENKIAQIIQFGGYNFTANTTIKSSFQLNQYDVGIAFGVPFIHAVTSAATLGFSGIDLDAGLCIKFIDFKASIENSNVTKSVNFTAPLPMIYGSLMVDFFKLKFGGEIKWIGYSGSSFLDLLLKGRFYIYRTPITGPSLFLNVGYRYEKIKANFKDFIKLKDVPDVNIEFEIKGPFAGIGFEF